MSNEEPTPPPVAPPPPAGQGLPDMSQPPKMSAPPTAFDRLIPAKNQNALVSYYLGLFSIFPLLGLVMGYIAVTRGRLALQAAKQDPSIAGAGHARVGIGCGAIGFLFNLTFLLVILTALIFGRGRQ